MVREFSLIEHVRSFNKTLGESVALPPGDDLGAIRTNDEGLLLAGVDQVLGGVHLPVGAAPERYARKVLRRSLSDVAAMAAIPTGALVTAALPSGLPEDWGARFADALNQESLRWSCPIFGGDVASFGAHSAVPLVTATVLATPDSQAQERIVCRSGARLGDRVVVTGSFGGSLQPDGSGHHESFEPRIDCALALHRLLGESLHCMIDVSDGLLADVGHLACESQLRFELSVEQVPRRDGASAICALTDGEDYELCFTVPREVDLPSEILNTPVTVVGTVGSGQGVVATEHGTEITVPDTGWEHQA